MKPLLPKLESTAANVLLAYAFLSASSYTLARTVGDSLFLSRVGDDRLALVFVFSGIATAVVASLWFVVTRKLPLPQIISISSLTFGIISIAVGVFLPAFHHSMVFIGAVYLLTEIKGCVNAINVVSAMSWTLGARSKKQSWARVGLGVPLAGIVAGIMLGVEADVISSRTWLICAGGMDIASVVIGWHLRRVRVGNPTHHAIPISKTKKRAATAKKYQFSRPLRTWLSILIAAKVAVFTFVSFEWKVAVNDFFQGDEHSMTRFFGIYYCGTGVLTLAVQFLMAERFLKSRSYRIPLLFMPVLLLLIHLGLLFGVGVLVALVLVSAGKSLDIWRRSIHDTTLNILYTNIQRHRRRSVIAFNNGFIKPTSEVAASLLLLATSVSNHRMFLYATAIVWLFAVSRLIRLLRVINRNRESIQVRGRKLEG